MVDHIQTAQDKLATFKERADRRLRILARVWADRSLPSNREPSPFDLIEAVTALTARGGKRVRPALAYAAACCFDHGIDDDTLLDATLSVELLQSYLLIHDDVMDDDPERRGGPSVHVVMTKKAASEVTGRSLAILAGDLGCAMSQELLICSDLPKERAMAAMAELVRMQWEVIQGQVLDVVGGADPALVQDAKTASYTTRGPVRLGAALAGAPPQAVNRLERYGTPLGQAFQIRDDLLGTFGKAASIGKPVGADLRAGKRTALVEDALATSAEEQRAELLAVLGDGSASDEAIEAACWVIEETGARQRSESRIEELTDDALEALSDCEFREEGLSFLRGVALLLADRDR